MKRSIRRAAFRAAVAASLAGHAGSAGARLSEEDLSALRLGAFHLGMPRSEVERVIASRTDITQPQVGGGFDSFDCDDLKPESEAPREDEEFTTPREIGFEDANGRGYAVDFERRPDEDRVDYVFYRDVRDTAGWSAHLNELEGRFGKADMVGEDRYGQPVALWCTANEDCRIGGNDPKAPRLSVKLLRPSPQWIDASAEMDVRDTLVFELHAGTDGSDERRAFYETLRARDPAEAQRLFELCRGPDGKFRTDEEAERYHVSLLPMGPDAAEILWNVEDVPRRVLAGLGFARGRANAFLGFRWARRVGELWLVASKVSAGHGVRWQYRALRSDQGGHFRKVWWDESLTGFNAWRESGAVPMIEQAGED